MQSDDSDGDIPPLPESETEQQAKLRALARKTKQRQAWLSAKADSLRAAGKEGGFVENKELVIRGNLAVWPDGWGYQDEIAGSYEADPERTMREEARLLIYGLCEVGRAIRHPRIHMLHHRTATSKSKEAADLALANYRDFSEELEECHKLVLRLPEMRLREPILSIIALANWELELVEVLSSKAYLDADEGGSYEEVAEIVIRGLRKCRQVCGLRFTRLASELAAWFSFLPPLSDGDDAPDITQLGQSAGYQPTSPITKQTVTLLEKGVTDVNALTSRVEGLSAANARQIKRRWKASKNSRGRKM